jgi:DNA-binding response OmpR family regulator
MRFLIRTNGNGEMLVARDGVIPPQKLHVLILSANRRIIESLRRPLGAAGCSVRASHGIAAGIRRFRLTYPDVLIMDARLLENELPEDVIQRFHVWRRRGDHYHAHGAALPTATPASVSESLTKGRLALDPAALSVRIGDRLASLTPTEFAILATLLNNRGKPLTRDELLDATKHEACLFDRVVDRHICNIRHKIDESPNSPSIIETVRGIGYRIAS